MTELDLYLSPVNEQARRIAAAKLGLVLEKFDFLRRCRFKWCSACRRWHPGSIAVFGVSSGKGDGLQNICKAARSRKGS